MAHLEFGGEACNRVSRWTAACRGLARCAHQGRPGGCAGDIRLPDVPAVPGADAVVGDPGGDLVPVVLPHPAPHRAQGRAFGDAGRSAGTGRAAGADLPGGDVHRRVGGQPGDAAQERYLERAGPSRLGGGLAADRAEGACLVAGRLGKHGRCAEPVDAPAQGCRAHGAGAAASAGGAFLLFIAAIIVSGIIMAFGDRGEIAAQRIAMRVSGRSAASHWPSCAPPPFARWPRA